MFRTIVVGVDGREGGRDALSLAARLAALNGGELVAVRVLPLDYYVSRAGAPTHATVAEQDARRETQEALDRAGVAARIVVTGDTSPARALHRVAEEERADVIVVGSTHHSRVGRVFAGDDAVATVHASPCPVAVAPRGLADRPWKHVERIGVGFDSSPEARQAFGLAVSLARDCGAAITVQSAVGTPIPYAEFSAYDPDWLEHARDLASEDLGELLAGVDVEASGDVVIAMPVDMLTRLSEDVDLLVLGSRAWGPVRRIVLGSTAAAVMRQAHCPVLVLPRGAATGQPGEREPGHETPASA